VEGVHYAAWEKRDTLSLISERQIPSFESRV
jgi:hypothetical protein